MEKTKEQMQMFVMILIFICTGFFVCVMYFMKPQIKKSEEYASGLGEIRRKIRTMKSALKGEKKIEANIKNAQKRIDDFEMLMPKGDESWSIEQIDQIAKKHGITIQKIQPEPSKKEKDYFEKSPKYDTRTMSVEVVSTYHQFGAFMNTIERSSPFLKIKSIDISAGKENNDYKHKINFIVEYLYVKEFD